MAIYNSPHIKDGMRILDFYLSQEMQGVGAFTHEEALTFDNHQWPQL